MESFRIAACLRSPFQILNTSVAIVRLLRDLLQRPAPGFSTFMSGGYPGQKGPLGRQKSSCWKTLCQMLEV